MKMEACKVLAHLLLDRRSRCRVPKQRLPRGVGGGPGGRLYRSEPAINALAHDPPVPEPLNNARSPGLCVSVDNNGPPPLPTSRPPPPPSHPPPPVPPHGQPLPQPPQQPLPPVPGHHQEYPSQAPGTCTLPRRGLVREDPANRFRSPSNPPPASHQPPPYSRHQPPDPFRRSRGPYQPPPPPKMDTRDPRDSRESREQDLRELRSAREPREREGRDVRLSRNLDDTRDADHREARDPRDRDAREHWDGRDFRGSHDPRDHQDPMAVRESRNFRELRESWERRNSNVPRDQSHEDNLRSSSLPRPAPETWVAQNNRWSTREPDSGFDSLTSPAMEGGPRSLPSPGGQNGRTVNPADVPYSQSTEDLLNASRTSPVSVSSATTSSSVSSPSPVQYPTIRAAKQPCVNGASHTSPLSHRSPHESPRPPSGSPRGLGPPHHHSSAVGPPPRPASPEGALLSDSVYPQHDTQPRYAEIPDIIEPRGKDDRLSHRLSRDLRDMRDVRDARDNRDLREAREPKRDTRDPKDKEPRNMRNSSEPRNNNRDMRTSREFRDTSLPRDFRDNRDSRTYLEVRDERHAREAETRGGYRELSVDVEDHDVAESRQERVRGRRDSRQYPPERAEGVKEVRFSSDPSDGLRVRDVPSYDRRDRDADGADGLQMNDDRGSSFQSREARGQADSRRGDGCTSSSSVSWMEWTQQLQAYVAWVNSQLRKRGRPLISDLRRDLQSGVVFADLIEIISGERVAGISREGESITPQVMRENLDRVLQFMAAKRIRMTHITSKEVAEGNLKSIMRIILALAAHYKPQSVKTSSPPHPQEVAATRPPPQPTTHDVGVGPDVPSTAPEKTPNLSTNRRAMVTGGAGDDQGALMVLRRHPSMTGAPATPRDSSPVYENLPRRVAPNRWAYDSLRASHKFQLSGPHGRRPGPPAMPPKANNLDESSDDAMNTSFNTSFNASLNTSLEGEGADVSSPGRTRPAALNFWQDLTSRRDPASSPPDPPPLPPSQPPPDDPDNPFRYHTIHRMSGRRKLPQIPGAAGPGSRVTTPQEGQESPRVPGDSPLDRNDERPGGGVGDEGSREPEGRSQNSSPATSLVRGPTLDQWSREKNPLDPWEQEDLKGVLRDLNTTRDQLLALQKLLQTTTEVESRGVCTSRDSPIIITPSSSATASQISASLAAGTDSPAAKTSHGKDDPSKTSSHSKDSPAAKTSHGKDDPTKTSSHSRDKTTKTKTPHGKEKAPRVAHVREDSNLEKSSRRRSSKDHQTVSNDHRPGSKDHHHHTVSKDHHQTVVSKDHLASSNDQQTFSNDHHRAVPKDHQTASNDQQTFSNDHRTASKDHQAVSKEPSSSRRSRRGHFHKRHSRQELESASRAGHGPRPTDHLVEASPTTVKQELLHLSLARQALEAEKVELTRLLEQREGIITELRKQMHQRDKTIQAQRAHFEDAIRNVQNGKRGGVAGDSPAGRSAVGSCAREELHLVRDAIVSLRSNFRETDPNQHTLDTLEQAIAILIERSGGSGGGGVSGDKTSRAGEKQRPPVNGVLEASTKVIYFTERTVTPFMSTINKRLGEIRLRDFKNMFDRPGLFRFHFKSYDPEYGMVKEEIVNDDDILPGVDGKIIAWVEEDAD